MSSQVRPGVLGLGRPQLSQRHGGMPGPVWMLLVWHLLGAVIMLASLLRPADTGEHLGARFGVLGYLVIAVIALLALRDKAPENLLRLLLLGNAIAIAASIATAAQVLGAVTYSLSYALVALYAAFWNSRAFGFVISAAITGIHLLALVVSGRFPELAPSWLAVSALCIAIVVVTNILVSGLERVAVIDPLTGVMNRLGLQTLAQMFPRSGRLSMPRVLVAIDLDHFKDYNDTYGHEAGDYLLKGMGATLRDELRGEDIIARLGGDEFVLVLMRTTMEDAPAVLSRLRGASPAAWSAGYVNWPGDESFDDALRRADVLLYEEKRSVGPRKRSAQEEAAG